MITSEYMPFIWIAIVAFFVFFEAITLGLTSIWFAGGAFISCLVSIFCDNLFIQIGSFVVASFVLLIITKPIVKKHVNNKIEKTNVDAIIGRTAIVLTAISPTEVGTVRVDGKEWSATSEELIKVGAKVKILNVNGVTLTVVPE